MTQTFRPPHRQLCSDSLTHAVGCTACHPCMHPTLRLGGQTAGGPDQVQSCLQQLWLHLLHQAAMYHLGPTLTAESLHHKTSDRRTGSR